MIVSRLVSVAKAALALSVSLIASCVTVGEKAGSGLVGKWRYANEMQVCQYVFHQNGTFGGYVISGGEMLSQFTGKWSLQGDAILYEYTSDTVGRIPAGTRDRDVLITIAKDYFVIEAADGSRRKYLRSG